jgi:hypothetical protein
MSDRKKAIETLKQLRLDYEEFYEEHNNEVTQAYDMAIASLETDEAYQLEYESTKNDLGVDYISKQEVVGLMMHIWGKNHSGDDAMQECIDAIRDMSSVTPQEPRWISASEKYEHHIDHTDCIWYGNDSGCPVTCSQYRDGWNDAMDYIFKNGDGYRPYRRNENG